MNKLKPSVFWLTVLYVFPEAQHLDCTPDLISTFANMYLTPEGVSLSPFFPSPRRPFPFAQLFDTEKRQWNIHGAGGGRGTVVQHSPCRRPYSGVMGRTWSTSILSGKKSLIGRLRVESHFVRRTVFQHYASGTAEADLEGSAPVDSGR